MYTTAMSFIRKVKRKGRVYLAEVENRRINGKVVRLQRRSRFRRHSTRSSRYSLAKSSRRHFPDLPGDAKQLVDVGSDDGHRFLGPDFVELHLEKFFYGPSRNVSKVAGEAYLQR
jgi:hypothetical protein